MRNHYIDNEALFQALSEHQIALKKAKKLDQERPLLSDYVGECFMKIAEHLSRKPNFMSYSFRDEMISDAVENCIQYVDNFDPKKSTNPFSYFTQIIYFAFLRRIAKEKKQLYVKYKATEQFSILHHNELHQTDDGAKTQHAPLYENITEFIRTFEEAKAAKKPTKKVKGIEKFCD